MILEASGPWRPVVSHSYNNNNTLNIEVLVHARNMAWITRYQSTRFMNHFTICSIGLSPLTPKKKLMTPSRARVHQQGGRHHGQHPRSLRDAGYFPGFINTAGDLLPQSPFNGEAVSRATYIYIYIYIYSNNNNNSLLNPCKTD